MATRYAFENLLRTPWEFVVSFVAVSFGIICVIDHEWMLLTPMAGKIVSVPFFWLAGFRLRQGLKILLYRKKLLVLRPFGESIGNLPVLKKKTYMGKGFRWLPIHTQRINLLSSPDNQRFMQKNYLYNLVQKHADKKPDGICDSIRQFPFLPFKAPPPVGGKPWLHGVGVGAERDIYLDEDSRKGHASVFGESRVGKSSLEAVIVSQDIMRGHAVIILDPKGDLFLAQSAYIACAEAGRLNDFYIVHSGMPELSAKINPLANYTDISEVATRITESIEAGGNGKQFKDFAWKFLNITAACLDEMGEQINYKSLAFFVTRPRQLLLAYCDKVLPKKDPNYLSGVAAILEGAPTSDKYGNPYPPMKRTDAARQYIDGYIDNLVNNQKHSELHDSIIADLNGAANLGMEYYDKITASLGPVFDKINKTLAGTIFSWDHAEGLPELNFESMIKRKQVVYICLDSQSNKEMAEGVGKAFIADLVSVCGRLYKGIVNPDRVLYLHADEFFEIANESAVTLLNKSGGAGVRTTIYAQTYNDIEAKFSFNPAKAKMLIGNTSNTIMLRAGNKDTSRLLIDCLEEVKIRSITPATMANDKADNNNELFNTNNTDTVNERLSKIITENDLVSLPKGQAFMQTNGGELYKVRIPLLETGEVAPESFVELMSEVNLCKT